jgi:hypothetical protein
LPPPPSDPSPASTPSIGVVPTTSMSVTAPWFPTPPERRRGVKPVAVVMPRNSSGAEDSAESEPGTGRSGDPNPWSGTSTPIVNSSSRPRSALLSPTNPFAGLTTDDDC